MNRLDILPIESQDPLAILNDINRIGINNDLAHWFKPLSGVT
jgi:hypothetical protein